MKHKYKNVIFVILLGQSSVVWYKLCWTVRFNSKFWPLLLLVGDNYLRVVGEGGRLARIFMKRAIQGVRREPEWQNLKSLHKGGGSEWQNVNSSHGPRISN